MATVVEKIFSAKLGRRVRADETVAAEIDACVLHDANGPAAARYFAELGGRVRSPGRHFAVLNDFLPCTGACTAGQQKKLREFARAEGVRVVDQGACHQVVIESGRILPGGIVIGTDSHACTYGALNAFSTGVGAAEAAAALAEDKCWFRVPRTIRVNFHGRSAPGVFSQDLALGMLRALTQTGALYQCLEFGGEALADLTVESRAVICGMAVEAGAKGAVMPCDAVLENWLSARGFTGYRGAAPDPGAGYARTVDIDVSALTPLVALPCAVDAVVPVEEAGHPPVDRVVIGSCTTGRYVDFEAAAGILRGKRVHPGVRLIAVPASREVARRMEETGVCRVLLEAGARVLPPCCGPCAGIRGGPIADGETVVATANRTGGGKGKIYIASPLVAACSALAGYLTAGGGAG